MKPKIKKKWVEALRSGKYKQGRHLLRKGSEFCCLGVLCDLHIQETGSAWKEGERGWCTYDGSVSAIPTKVLEWSRVKQVNVLIGMNDVQRNSFHEIADYIETHL